MTKAELLKEFDKLQKEKEMRIEGIHCNSNKRTIENAIECLKCPDELLEKYLTVVSLKYENIGRTIAEVRLYKNQAIAFYLSNFIFPHRAIVVRKRTFNSFIRLWFFFRFAFLNV